MPLYKDYAVIASGMSLADKGKPGRYVPFASVLAWMAGSLRLTRQFMWDELESGSLDEAKLTAQTLAQRAIDRGEVDRAS